MDLKSQQKKVRFFSTLFIAYNVVESYQELYLKKQDLQFWKWKQYLRDILHI